MVLAWKYGKVINGIYALQWSYIEFDKKTIYILWNIEKANKARDKFGALDPKKAIVLEFEVADNVPNPQNNKNTNIFRPRA